MRPRVPSADSSALSPRLVIDWMSARRTHSTRRRISKPRLISCRSGRPITLGRPLRQEIKRGLLIRRRVECVRRALIQSMTSLGERALESADGTLGRIYSLAPALRLDAGGAREGGRSHPHRDQKEGDCQSHEDCASLHASASYI